MGTEQILVEIPEPPPGCYRAHCWCMWWLLANVSKKKDRFCERCGVPIKPATKQILEFCGLVEVKVARKEPDEKPKPVKGIDPQLW